MKEQHCAWCTWNGNACRTQGDVDDCDFRTLPMQKEKVLARIQEERKYIEEHMHETKSQDDVALLMDKVGGIIIMKNVLVKEFGMDEEEVGRATSGMSWMKRMRLVAKMRSMRHKRAGE